MHDREIIAAEIGKEIADGKGCIIFDLGCFFPYTNQDILTFDFKLGEEQLEPYKHNHRYPNNGYVTISKKMGRRVSKLGYPEFVELDQEQIILLGIHVGIKEKALDLVFPVNVTLTKEKPVCSLTFHFNFDKTEFDFSSAYKQEDGSWRDTRWTNREDANEHDIIMSAPTVCEGSYTAMYSEVITPYPQALDDLMIL